MNVSNARRLTCGLMLTGAVAGTAIAATPESGSVSKAAPKVEWTGETIGSYFSRVPTAVTEDDSVPCQAPSCDSFALTVADSANLTIAADIDQEADNAGSVTLRVRQPDGTVIVGSSGADEVSDGKPYKIQIKNAKTGDYTVEYWNNFFDGPITYSGYAELAVAAPASGAPAGGQPPAPQPTPAAGGPAPGPAPTQAIALSVKSAKAKGKKGSAKVTVSRTVKAVLAQLKKGKKVVATGKRGETTGTATIKFKAKKKLKKGKYTLTVTVTDGSTSAAKTVKVKVKK
jgi:hypothetical protein